MCKGMLLPTAWSALLLPPAAAVLLSVARMGVDVLLVLKTWPMRVLVGRAMATPTVTTLGGMALRAGGTKAASSAAGLSEPLLAGCSKGEGNCRVQQARGSSTGEQHWSAAHVATVTVPTGHRDCADCNQTLRVNSRLLLQQTCPSECMPSETLPLLTCAVVSTSPIMPATATKSRMISCAGDTSSCSRSDGRCGISVSYMSCGVLGTQASMTEADGTALGAQESRCKDTIVVCCTPAGRGCW
jgi:hypothetical protein